MTICVGRISTKLIPVRAVVVLGFEIWNVQATTWLTPAVLGTKAWTIVGGPTTVVESVPTPLAAPPPLTATALLYTPMFVPLTLTVRVIAGREEPVASTVVVVQVKVPRTQFHPVPPIAVAVKPLGSVSVTVTVPEVEELPLLATDRV
jgi:hypothetical protein